MSEFKGQILGIILVLSIFLVLNSRVSEFFGSTLASIQTLIMENAKPVETE